MKKLILLALSLVMTLSLCACGGGETPDTPEEPNATVEPSIEEEPTPEPTEEPIVKSTEYITIDGICVNDSYRDEDNSPLRTVYMFYTLSANDSNLEIDSKYTTLTINETNSYESEHSPYLCKSTPNYYYSSYIEDVYVDTSLKVVATFKIPEADLVEGRSISITDSQIPEIEMIRLSTVDIQHFNSEEDIAKAMDLEGYNAEMAKYELADEETTTLVKNSINGYYFSFYLYNIAHEIEFYADNNYEIRTSLGTTTGTYTVTNGYVVCTNETTQAVNNLPYWFENGKIYLDALAGFDVMG